jgi:LacI family transcriptional regulator
MACSDQCGPVLLEACRRARAAVPDEVAVIGVDNDEPLCEAADPPMSSVWPDHLGVGYAAAALLDRLMAGRAARGTPPPAPVYLAPRGVVTRQSTDVLAVEDRDVAAAVRFIREHACGRLVIDDVAGHVSLSRSALQRRFKKVVGRTIHEEALRIRLDRARELLSHTDLPIALVAEKAGFTHQEYLGSVFRSRLGQTPAQFRRASRP